MRQQLYLDKSLRPLMKKKKYSVRNVEKLLIDYTLARKSSSICLSILIKPIKQYKKIFTSNFIIFNLRFYVLYSIFIMSYLIIIKIILKIFVYKSVSKSEQSSKMSSKMDELLDGWLRIL